MLVQVLFVIVLVVGLAFFFWSLLRKTSQQISAQFAQLAERFGLELTQPPAQLAGFNRPEPFVHGEYRGRELSISVPGKGLQNTRQIETTLKVGVDDKALSFQMTGSGLLGRMRQRDSGTRQRWSSGQPEFDQAIDVRTNNDARMLRLLPAAELSRAQQLLTASKGSLTCREGILIFSKLGLISNPAERERFEAATELLCDWAERIEASS